MNKYLVSLLSAAVLSTVALTASAEEVSLHLTGGAAESLPTSQPADVFSKNPLSVGMTGDAKLLLPVVPHLAIGPSLTVSYLPQAKDNANAAVLWDLGYTARLQGDHAAGWVPYVDVTGAMAKQGQVLNPGVLASAGFDFATDPSHVGWLGVYVSYNHTFQVHSDAADQTALMPHTDANVVSTGVSISFDYPPTASK
jgi:hypothetical protein